MNLTPEQRGQAVDYFDGHAALLREAADMLRDIIIVDPSDAIREKHIGLFTRIAPEARVSVSNVAAVCSGPGLNPRVDDCHGRQRFALSRQLL